MERRGPALKSSNMLGLQWSAFRPDCLKGQEYVLRDNNNEMLLKLEGLEGGGVSSRKATHRI